MGLGHGNTPTWLNQTDSGRTWTSANRVVQSGLVLNLDAGVSASYAGSGKNFVSAKIYSVYNGGLRSSNYSVQYSDDNSNWTTAFSGVASNNSSCGIQQNTGSGNGSYGLRRFWRYVEGSPVVDHHPRVSRILFTDINGYDFNYIVYSTDNCSDSGQYIIGTPASVDFAITWTDLSGNGNSGTLTNGPTYSSANGGSIVFDGSNDYVQLSPQNIRAVNFSVELWFYATSVSGNNVLYTSYNLPGGAQSQTFILELAGGKLYSSNGNGAGAFPSTTTVSNNTWYHVVATYTSSSSTQNLYVNGNLEVSGVGAINNEASSNFIGGSPGDNNIGSRWFGGRISAVRVYRTKALSAAEVSQNFNALRGRYGI